MPDEQDNRHSHHGRLRHVMDNLPVAVMTVDLSTFCINYANGTAVRTIAALADLLPIKAADLVGASVDLFYHDPELARQILGDPTQMPHSMRIRLGDEVLDIHATAVNDEDESYLCPMLTWTVVTREIVAEERILQLAHYDSLTGLPNRTTFFDRLNQRISSTQPRFSLLYLDLDGFKLVNDSYGHIAGDGLLRLVAERLLAQSGHYEATVARLGGDEFAVIVDETEAQEIIRFSRNVIDALSAPFRLSSGITVQIGVSIGLAIAPDHGHDADTLLAHSDIALYSAKSAGRRTVRIFTAAMAESLLERMRLESDLREALDSEDGLFVFYQPITNIQSGLMVSREALVRWHHPQRGWVSPAEFIPVAEQSGLIHRLGEFVLVEACRAAQTWADQEQVAVNISAKQLGQGTLVPTLVSVLEETGLDATRLEIEVTETALLSDEIDCVSELRAVRSLGVKVALDDFGTGFSSLSHLRSFPFDKIKIDGSFVREAAHRPESAAIVNMIAQLGQKLGVTTVAEGVETSQHLHQVKMVGCVEVQGYLLGHPVPEEADRALIAGLRNQLMALPASQAEVTLT